MWTYRLRRVWLTAALLVATAGSTLLAGATVRGRVVREGAHGQSPAAGVAVSVTAIDSKLGRSAPTFTGTDGMYYLYNVPAGTYRLEIRVSKDRVTTYTIRVGNSGFTDIAPVVVP